MNSVFTAKLLQNLRNKKANKGFTLIELLVVVIIIGVLAAVALPNLLGQVGKARESEAKSTLGAVNRAQQAYFTEKASFATTSDLLEVPTPDGNYYSYSINADAAHEASGLDNEQNGTRDYVSGVGYNTDTRVFSTIVCRATNAESPAFDLNVTDDITGTGSSDTAAAACNGNSDQVK